MYQYSWGWEMQVFQALLCQVLNLVTSSDDHKDTTRWIKCIPVLQRKTQLTQMYVWDSHSAKAKMQTQRDGGGAGGGRGLRMETLCTILCGCMKVSDMYYPQLNKLIFEIGGARSMDSQLSCTRTWGQEVGDDCRS